jgi:hypothetical protein
MPAMIRLATLWFLSDYEHDHDDGPKEHGTYDQRGTGLLELAHFLSAFSFSDHDGQGFDGGLTADSAS